MCGIVGWINRKEDLTPYRQVFENMSETLNNRGPDAAGYYISQNALLSNRRLIVVDPEGGSQPMTRTLGGKSFTIVYNGELYNTGEIRKILQGRGHSFRSYSDTEALLLSYIEWGPKCLDYLNGIFAFGIWDQYKQQVFLARDRMGVKPLFYAQRGDSFLFGSEIKALLAHPRVDPVVDQTGLLEIFGLGPARSPGNGIFQGIEEIRPGHCLTFDERGLRVWQYWKLENKPHTETLEATAEHLRSLVTDSVQRQLVSDVPVCSFLSGGTDSSAISAIASTSFKNNGRRPLKTFSIDYLENDIHFQPSHFQPNSDSRWIGVMVEHIGSDHQNVLLDTPELAASLRDAVLANDYPGMADIDSSLYLFCREVKKCATVALSGECADEIFGGYPWYRSEEDLQANTFPWSKFVGERRKILSGVLAGLPLEDYVDAKYKETLAEVPVSGDESRYAHRMRELFYLNFQWFMITLLNRKDRMSMANGLEVRVPYADHRLVEYAWNIPPEYKFCDNMEKGLLRRALKPILPERILKRKKSPYPKTHNPTYTRAVQKGLKEILEDTSAPLHRLINVKAVSDIVASGGASYRVPWFGQLMRGPQLMAYLIQLNIWLEEYKVILQ